MPPVQPDPTVRSATEARALRYREYLRSAWWFSRRNQALRDAGYRCQQCETKRDLQVHHVSYERLGAELPEDLVVVCRGCHLGHHFNETQEGIGIYTKILSQVIQDLPAAEFVDVIEEAKLRCAKAKIKIEPYRFNAAVARVNSRITFKPPEHNRELFDRGEEGQPLTHAEACGLLARITGCAAIKHMPEVKLLSERGEESVRAYGLYMQAIQEQVKRCEEVERDALEAEAKAKKP